MKKWSLLLLICFSFNLNAQTICESDFFTIKINALFEGLWNGENMNNSYKSKNVLPTMQPYTRTIYGYVGLETINKYNNSEIVDWAVVCLRDKTEQVISQRGLLILSDGTLVSYLGEECVEFYDVEKNGKYFISIHHLGHLGVMSSERIASGEQFTLSNGMETVKGFEQLVLDKGKYVVPVGDFNGDQIINNLDFNMWAEESSVVNKYRFHDADGNAIINNIDYNFWKKNRSKIGYSKASLTKKDCPYCNTYEYIEPD